MKLQSVQALRGVAALGVVLSHAGLTHIGVAGVDLFFVISGFVIATVAPGKEPLQFAWDRFWRIFPLYWLLSAPWLILAYAKDLDTPLRSLASVTLLPLGTIPYLRPGWSLIFEIMFYGAALVVLATGRWRPLLALFVGCLMWGYFWPNPVVGYLGYPLTLNFLMGVGIARFGPVSSRNGAAFMILGSAALLLAPDMSGGAIATADHHSYRRAIFWGIPCAMIVCGASSLRGNWPLQRLGDASYSIYLVHLAPVMIFPPPVGVPLAVALGFAVHYWIEKQILRAKPRLKWRRAVTA